MNNTEYEEQIRYLTGRAGGIGLSRDEAELRLLDDDLWLVPPEQRYTFESEAGAREWDEAARHFDHRAYIAQEDPMYSLAAAQLYQDAAYRARVLAYRVRERLQETE